MTGKRPRINNSCLYAIGEKVLCSNGKGIVRNWKYAYEARNGKIVYKYYIEFNNSAGYSYSKWLVEGNIINKVV